MIVSNLSTINKGLFRLGVALLVAVILILPMLIFQSVPRYASAQSGGPMGSNQNFYTILSTSPVAASDAASSSTVHVDLTTSTGLSAQQLANQIALGNIYYRVEVFTDGTVNGKVNFRFTDVADSSAAGNTAALTGVVVNEGTYLIVKCTGRYLHYAGVGSDTDHSIAVTQAGLSTPF